MAFLAFSLGALTIAGGILLLFYNGVILGAVATMYILDGVPLFFFAWVGPHGALELPAIIFGGAAGLVAGRALLMPGDLSRAASLRRVLPVRLAHHHRHRADARPGRPHRRLVLAVLLEHVSVRAEDRRGGRCSSSR